MNTEDDFAAAFAQAISADQATSVVDAAPAGDTDQAAPVVDAAPANDTDQAASVVDATQADDTDPKPADQVTPPVVAYTKQEPTPQQAAPAPVAAPVPAVEEPSFPDPVLTPEQQRVLDQLKKDWPDIAEAQEAKVAHAIASVESKFSRALVEVVKKMYSDIAPMAGVYAETAQTKFRDTVLKAHDDYDQVYTKLEPWIGQQPGYLKKAYQQAYHDGTAEEVIDLVQRFKDANGVKPQMPDPTPAPTVNIKKVESLAPVSGKRSIVATKGSDPNDYKGAFSEAANSL